MYGIFRLNTDGSLDGTFTSPFTSVTSSAALAVQADGKILLGADGTDLAGSGHDNLVRLNPDGSVDTTFHADATTDGPVRSLAIQADGDILVGGAFNTMGGVSQAALARLNGDGSLDSSFAPAITYWVLGSLGGLTSIQVQTNGTILLAGFFSDVNSVPMGGVALLNANGTNATFNDPDVGVVGTYFAQVAEVTASGSILVGGRFFEVADQDRVALAELENGVASQSLSLPLDTKAQWLRSGTLEVPGVEFSVSQDGSQTWTSLGAGARISGGWEKAGLTLPESGYLRARLSGAMDQTQGYAEEMMAFSALTAGTLDSGFHPDANRAVHTMAEQPDGKLLLGGTFVTMDGVSHVRAVRILPNGTVDPTFFADITWPGASDIASVYVASMVVQPDGKIIVGGNFTRIDNVIQSRFGRLNSNGSRDTGFTPDVSNGIVNAIVLQPDGKILIAGNFTTVDGFTRTRLARLHSNGALDTGFTPTANVNVHSMVLQPDGKIIIGGNFTTVNGSTKTRIARLNSDGTLDTGFTTTANGIVYGLALQPDGKIVMGGNFTTVNGSTKTRIARLNSDGSLDSGFSALATANNTVSSLTLQTDGKIVVSGELTQLNGATIGRCGRLNSNGTRDTGFNAGSTANVLGNAVRKDGRIVIGGTFTTVQSTARDRVAQLNNDLIYQKLSVVNAGRLEWIRSGASPEASRVTFELSTDGGSTWGSLGAGTRINGGWELTGLSLTTGRIRARAFIPGGENGSSSGLVETVTDF